MRGSIDDTEQTCAFLFFSLYVDTSCLYLIRSKVKAALLFRERDVVSWRAGRPSSSLPGSAECEDTRSVQTGVHSFCFFYLLP